MVVSRSISPNPEGTALARAIGLMASVVSGDLTAPPRLVAEQRFADSPQVSKYFEAMTRKAAIGPSHTQAGASPLATVGLAAEYFGLDRDVSIIGRLTGMRRVPFMLDVPRETSSATSGGWVGEGEPIPVRLLNYDQFTLQPLKVGAITVLSRELVRRVGERTVDRTIVSAVVGGTAAYMDSQFLTPSVTATAGNPASITSGGTPVTSTGGTAPTAAQLVADLGSMVAAITTSGTGLVWIMRRTTAARIALALGAAASDIPRTLLGIPLVLSSTSPAQITLVDTGEIAFAEDENGLDIEVAEQASLQMDDAPTNAGLSPGSPSDEPIATEVLNLWQTGLVGVKVERRINWEVARSGAVAYMTVSY